MTHTVVYYKVVRDNTGIHEEIPVILTEFGPLQPLIRYLLKDRHVSSGSSTNKLVQAVGLLIDYMAANHSAFDNPHDLFNTFVQRLYSGTVGSTATTPVTCSGMPARRLSCACWLIIFPGSPIGWRRNMARSSSILGGRPHAPRSNWHGRPGSTRRTVPSRPHHER